MNLTEAVDYAQNHINTTSQHQPSPARFHAS